MQWRERQRTLCLCAVSEYSMAKAEVRRSYLWAKAGVCITPWPKVSLLVADPCLRDEHAGTAIHPSLLYHPINPTAWFSSAVRSVAQRGGHRMPDVGRCFWATQP